MARTDLHHEWEPRERGGLNSMQQGNMNSLIQESTSEALSATLLRTSESRPAQAFRAFLGT